MNQTTRTLIQVCSLVLICVPALALGQTTTPAADTISVQFTGNQYTGGGGSLLAPTESAGLTGYESKHYNAFNLDTDGNALADSQLDAAPLLQDAAGASSPTAAKLTTTGFTDVLLTGSNNATPNEKLYKHGLAILSRAPSATIKVDGLAASGYGTYDLIVYLSREFFGGNPAQNAMLEVNGGAATAVQVPHYPVNRALAFQDATVIHDGDKATQLGAYARFTKLSGDLTLTLHSAIGGTIGISGFQIVKVSAEATPSAATEPATDSKKSIRRAMPSDILVVSPAYCSDVKGNTPIVLDAPAYKQVTVYCWKQGGKFGKNATVATVRIDANGKGTFVFPAEDYPHGPVTLRISGVHGDMKDNCYLQLYNRGGVSWNEGLPKDPPAAEGLALVFADDFTGPLSIGKDASSTYYAHKPPDGSQDFSSLPFADFSAPNNPFAQVDTYLRIRASEKAKSSGIISSLKPDGSGIQVTAPCYFECRFIGPTAPGSWPAFWLMSLPGPNGGCDELDIIEAYGGEGPGYPNAGDSFRITPHAWGQGEAGAAMEARAHEGLKNPVHMNQFGIPSTWYEACHTYGCKITETDTIYYVDNIEVGRHPSYALSKTQPMYFLVNLATSGGWPVDLSRYDGVVDMYVDFVRVYAAKK